MANERTYRLGDKVTCYTYKIEAGPNCSFKHKLDSAKQGIVMRDDENTVLVRLLDGDIKTYGKECVVSATIH